MANIYIHIGLNKTGTSSIQDFFAMNDAVLAQEGYVYPKAGRDSAAHHPLSALLKRTQANVEIKSTDLGKQLLAEIADARNVVLSSEDLHTLDARKIGMLGQLFQGHSVRVFLYVREHLGYLSSWYQQNIQASHLSCAFDTFCYFTKAPLHIIADRWANEFGHDRIVCRIYDRSQLFGGDIVADFTKLIGIDAAATHYTRKPYESNPSVAGNLLFVKRLMNNFLSKAEAMQLGDQVTALSQMDKRYRAPMYIDKDIVAYVSGMYSGDRDKLLQRYGIAIKPVQGAREGSATPDFAALANDWRTIQAEAAKRSLSFARYMDVIKLGDLSKIG